MERQTISIYEYHQSNLQEAHPQPNPNNNFRTTQNLSSTKIVEAGRTLLANGPCAITLQNGKASVLAAPVVAGERMLIRELKRVPVFVEERAEFTFATGANGSLSDIEGNTIPDSWKSTAEAVEDLRDGKVAILGGVDSGKSTFCAYLANFLYSKDLRVRIVDADIGQADLGPPATISSLEMQSFAPILNDLVADENIFVGHVTPSRVEAKLLGSLTKLVEKDEDDEVVIINTDGWIGDADAIRFKLNLVRSSEIDVIVTLGLETEVQELLAPSKVPRLAAERPQAIRYRSQSERRTLREAAYRRFLHPGQVFDLYLDGINVEAPPGLVGDVGIIARQGTLERLMVGLIDDEGYLLEIGVCKRIRLPEKRVQVFTRSKPECSSLEFSCIQLSEEGEELGFFDAT